MSTCKILMISGSLRSGSTNSALLATAAAVGLEGISAELYSGMADLPHFNPDDDIEPLHPAVAELRGRLDHSDAVLICTPEYAGALPGSFKNLLDWTVGGGTYAKPVAWVNASTGTGAVDAHESLQRVLERTGTDIVRHACADIPVARGLVGADGLISDARVREEVTEVQRRLCAHVARKSTPSSE